MPPTPDPMPQPKNGRGLLQVRSTFAPRATIGSAFPSSGMKFLSRGPSAELNSRPGMRYRINRHETGCMPKPAIVPIETAAVSFPTCAGLHDDAARYPLNNRDVLSN